MELTNYELMKDQTLCTFLVNENIKRIYKASKKNGFKGKQPLYGTLYGKKHLGLLSGKDFFFLKMSKYFMSMIVIINYNY